MTQKETIKQNIANLEKTLKDPKVPASFKDKLKSGIAQLEGELKALEQADKKIEDAKTPAQTQSAKDLKKKKVSKVAQILERAKKMNQKVIKLTEQQISKKIRRAQKLSTKDADIEKDAKQPAMARSKRTSQGLTGNQYVSKADAKGRTYYEYRDNRTDRQQPSKTYPKLEEGGKVYSKRPALAKLKGMSKGKKPVVTRGFSDDEAYEYGDGGYMAKGGRLSKGSQWMMEWRDTEGNKGYDILEIVDTDYFSNKYGGSPHTIRTKIIDSSKKDRIGKYDDDSRQSLQTYIKNNIIRKLEDGGYMAKGGKPRVIRGFSDDEAYEYGDGGYMAKGGMVVTKIKDIPNFSKRLAENKITYRGLGSNKLAKDFYKATGTTGVRIKVDGVEYFITDEEFDTFSRDSNGKMKIRFDAPPRKGYANGGMIEHGLEIGDKVYDSDDENELIFVENDGIDYEVDLQNGRRYRMGHSHERQDNYASGGYMAKGGKPRVTRGFSDDEAYEYGHGGKMAKNTYTYEGYDLVDINGKKIKEGDIVKTTQPSGGILSPSDAEIGVVEKTKDAFGREALQIKFRKEGRNFDQYILLNGQINEVISKQKGGYMAHGGSTLGKAVSQATIVKPKYSVFK